MTTTNQTDAQMKLAREWECFQDAAYYDMYCVRLVSDRTFGKGFHLINKDEAFGLRDLLNTRQATEARAQGLVDALEDSKRAVQAFLDMVNVMQRVQALPIPAFLETAQHNCPIILQNLDQALATWRRT